MGAFDFAMGTLSSLSSAFSLSKGTRKSTVNLNDLSIILDDNARRACSDFATGMRMLHKHSVHHSFSVDSISQQNLKLLHTNLKANRAYRNTIAKIRSRAVKSNHWAWLPLLQEIEINAGLLYLPTGHTVSPQTAGANVTIHKNELHTPFATAAKTKVGYQLYLGLMGSTYIECIEPAAAVSRNELPIANSEIASAPICVKRGDTFIEDPRQSCIRRLFSSKGPSLLLNVHLL
ncbi:hypothetical protein [Kaarinaea lacus]